MQLSIFSKCSLPPSKYHHGRETQASENGVEVSFSFFPLVKFMYLSMLGLSCGTQDLRFSSWRVGSSSLTRE